MKVVIWGTYDLGKPRIRILLRGLRENGVEVLECHKNIWEGIEDKSQVKGLTKRLSITFRWLASYPRLLWRYTRLPKHDAVLLGYFGYLDIFFLWPIAKLRRIPILLDAFIPLYNTIVEDRRLITKRNPIAFLIYAWEWLALRAADEVLTDTSAHGTYFTETFKLPSQHLHRVFVGVETEFFSSQEKPDQPLGDDLTVLFYGQFIPLHGIDTIIRAAQSAGSMHIKWVLIGSGQEEDRIRTMIQMKPVHSLRWISWVDYSELQRWIQQADICLGIFGTSAKAARVIPNKVFQLLAAGTPLITRDSPAIRELLSPSMPGIYLVQAGSSESLLAAIEKAGNDLSRIGMKHFHHPIATTILPHAIGRSLLHGPLSNHD